MMDAETIKAVAELAWPIIAAVILLALLPSIRRVAQSRGFTIKYGQMELSVQDASDQLRKQIEDLQNQVRGLQEQRVVGTKQVSKPIASPARTSPRTILWVDDKPQNNAHEIAKLQDDGWEITAVKSTSEALDFLQRRSTTPSVIISDMARRDGLTYRPSAGLDLIREIRAKNKTVPIFVYTTSAVDKYRDQVRELGGNGITNSPIELFSLVEGAVRDPA